MKYLGIFLICVLVVVFVYVLNVYQPNDDINTVYRRLLINNTEKPIIAFTYKKLGNKYENYYLGIETLRLEKRIEPFPVNHDGLPALLDEIHGNKEEISDGFRITGIDFPFRCPQPFVYDGKGRCVLQPVCGENDENFYKGINYYQFNERFARNLNYHSRLYYDCANPDDAINCNINELYIGGEKLEKPAIPCVPYDICQDRMSRTIHRYPIFQGDSLNDREFYICNNGISERRTCSENQQFSSIVMGCVDRNLCANETNGTTFKLDDTRFILCNNGTEVTINCGIRVIQSDITNEYECRNPRCENQLPNFETINRYFRIPLSILYCEPNNNVLRRFECDPEFVINQDNPNVLNNSNYILPVLSKRYEDFDVPTKILGNFQCVPFDLDLHTDYILTRIKDRKSVV